MTASITLTIGLDVSDRVTHGCVLDDQGGCTEEFEVRTARQAITDRIGRYATARVVLEAGPYSPLSRLLRECGHEVVVANARRVQLIGQSDRKTDRNDPEILARLGRIDPALLAPVTHRSEQAQRDLTLLRVRDALVRNRTSLINQARGLTKALGERLPGCGANVFATRMRRSVGGELFPGFAELLDFIHRLTHEIRRLDRRLEALCRDHYPAAGRLRQVPGVGPVTALAFVLTIDDPTASRAVGGLGRISASDRGNAHRANAIPNSPSRRPAARSCVRHSSRPRTIFSGLAVPIVPCAATGCASRSAVGRRPRSEPSSPWRGSSVSFCTGSG